MFDAANSLHAIRTMFDAHIINCNFLNGINANTMHIPSIEFDFGFGYNNYNDLAVMVLPLAVFFFGAVMVLYVGLVVLFFNTDHTVMSLLKMNGIIGFQKGSRPPVAPFGMWECIHYMTSDQQPWFPLRAKKALNNTDTFVLPLPRRPVMTGDYRLAREVLTDPLSTKPRTYQEFEPLGVGSIFTRNGSYWVSNKHAYNIRIVYSIVSNGIEWYGFSSVCLSFVFPNFLRVLSSFINSI